MGDPHPRREVPRVDLGRVVRIETARRQHGGLDARLDRDHPHPVRRSRADAASDSFLAYQTRTHFKRFLVGNRHDFVHDGIDRALDRGQTPYLTRWFTGLAVQVSRVAR